MTKIIYMGTPEFAVPALQALIEAGYDIVAVYSQPPRPKNRGHQVTKSPIHEFAEAHNIPVYTPVSLRTAEAQEEFKAHQADLAIVAAYGLILPKFILEAPRMGCLNIHGSLLPAWRGAAPIHRAMIAGDTLTGITLMQMDEGLDTGAMLAKSEYMLSDNDRFADVHDDLAKLGAALLIEMLPPYLRGDIAAIMQNNDAATYANKLKKEEGALDFTLPAVTILRMIKTLNPWPGTSARYKDIQLKILDAELSPEHHDDKQAGTLLDGAKVVCGDGHVLALKKLQRPGGKPLEIKDFLRGFLLEPGERFY